MKIIYDKTSLYERLKNLDLEEQTLIKQLNYFYIDKENRNKYFERLIDVRCWKKELKDKIYFFKQLEKQVNK